VKHAIRAEKWFDLFFHMTQLKNRNKTKNDHAKIDQLSVEIRILNMQGLAEGKSQIFLHSPYAED